MAGRQTNHEGSCQCGSVKLEVSGEPMMMGNCSCLDCQKTSGAGHVPFAVFGEAGLKTTGETRTHSFKAASGNDASTTFCPKCGSTLMGRTSGAPGTVAIRMGALDTKLDFKPQFDVWTKRKHSWDHDFAGVPGFAGNPPMPG